MTLKRVIIMYAIMWWTGVTCLDRELFDSGDRTAAERPNRGGWSYVEAYLCREPAVFHHER